MATLHEYYEKDFENTVKLYFKTEFQHQEITGAILYDFSAACAFSCVYLPYGDFDFSFFKGLIEKISAGGGVTFDSMVKLPSLKTYHGDMKFENTPPFKVLSRFYGESQWVSIYDLTFTKRIFIYSEKDLSDDELKDLYEFSKGKNCNLQFRSMRYKDRRIMEEKPMAFICHDSRDKESVANPLALELQRLWCPVWYDEFSLKIGDNLRLSIEKGLKECKKCILVLSQNFLNNKGWTKTEFDSIFTRQILEETNLVLPIWLNITKQQVFDYSPSLLNIKGLNWTELGTEEIARQISRVIDV